MFGSKKIKEINCSKCDKVLKKGERYYFLDALIMKGDIFCGNCVKNLPPITQAMLSSKESEV